MKIHVLMNRLFPVPSYGNNMCIVHVLMNSRFIVLTVKMAHVHRPDFAPCEVRSMNMFVSHTQTGTVSVLHGKDDPNKLA